MLLVGCADTVMQTLAPRSVLSWIPRRVQSGAADGMWRHMLSCAHQSSVLGPASDFHDELQNRCQEREKTHGLKMQMLGSTAHSVSAGDFGKSLPRHTNARFIRLT